ncbi:MAG: hypothetical protein ABJH98_06185 [Reichenbachiella sp.]|uniref:hypothetical protein n=1 Tax=Reichenbachiella sp. TaxID=2184521 RepID=UPI003297C0A7
MKGLTKYWNKISGKTLLLFAVFSSFIFSCQEPDPYPITPQIYFNNIQYVELLENGNPDSLILYFDFEDGNGDLGLEGDEIQTPYQDYNFYYDANGVLITYDQTDVNLPITIYDPAEDINITFDEDIRPSYDCINYEILYIDYENRRYLPPGTDPDDIDTNVYEQDTVFLQRNPFRNNIEVKYFRKTGIDEYEEIDWRYRASEYGCGLSFDGRFPILDFESLSNSGSLEGTIKYGMVSAGFRTVLKKDTFNIKFRIMDRSLRQSNFAETGDITLDQLIR